MNISIFDTLTVTELVDLANLSISVSDSLTNTESVTAESFRFSFSIIKQVGKTTNTPQVGKTQNTL